MFKQLKPQLSEYKKRAEILSFYLSKGKLLLKRRPGKEVSVIICFDGSTWHGGIMDRLKGIISFYALCQHLKISFYIHFESPFKLENYLIPANYQWLPNDESGSKFSLFSDRLLLAMDKIHLKPEKTLLSAMKKRRSSMFHVYSNVDFASDYSTKSWGQLFLELFKHAPKLENALAKFRPNQTYTAMHGRFIGLLGDFKDVQVKALNSEEKENLVAQCVEYVQEVARNNYPKPLLVLADSSTFLARINSVNGVITIPGDLSHTDRTSKDDEEAHLKTFIDLFLLSEAEQIYQLKFRPMYNSAWPRYAKYLKPSAIQ